MSSVMLPLLSSPPQYPNRAVDRRDLVCQLGEMLPWCLGSDVACICADYLVPPDLHLILQGLRHNHIPLNEDRGNYDNWMPINHNLARLCSQTFKVHHGIRFGAVREQVNRRFTISQGWEIEIQVGGTSLYLQDRETVAEVMRDHQMNPNMASFNATLVTLQEKYLRAKNVELASDGKTVQYQTFSPW